MRGFAAIFRREIAERRLILLAGLIGLVPLALPLLPGVPGGGGADLRSTTALVVALLVSGGLAVLLGSTAIGSELTQGRLGFYFSRPLSGWAIWAGKLGAAFALSIATALLAALPGAAIDGLRPWGLLANDLPQPRLAFPDPVFTVTWFFLAWAVLVLLAVLAAHAMSVMIRSRSPLLALDLAALAVVAGLALAGTGRLRAAGAVDPLILVSAGLALLAAAALAIAGAAQVIAGRTDARRGHRALSLALWGPLLAAALAAPLYARWVLAATPADLAYLLYVEPAPAGSWAELVGVASHRGGYVPSFLVDLRSGRFLRLPPSPLRRISADGRRAAWVDGGAVVAADLSAARPAPVRGRLAFEGPRDLALSPDGTRVAAIASGRLLAADLASGRLLAAAPLDSLNGLVRGIVWSDPAHVRLYHWVGRVPADLTPGWDLMTEIVELDLATGKLERTGSFVAPGYPPFALSPDLRRLAIRDAAAGRPIERVLDARTGSPLFEIPAAEALRSFAFLAAGRSAELADERGQTRELAVYGTDGREQARFALAGPRVRLGGQPDAGHLVYAERGAAGPWTARLLDLATGAARPLGRDLLPLRTQEGSLPPPDLFWRRGELVRLDLATGAARVIFTAPAANP